MIDMNLVTPKARAKHEPFVQQTGLSLLNSESDLSSTTKLTKITPLTIMTLVTPKAVPKHEPLFNKLASEVGLLNI
jgi:hypothetical protein